MLLLFPSAALVLSLKLGATLALSMPGAAASLDIATGSAVEVVPAPPTGALEEGMTGEVGRLYAAGINAIRATQHRRALTLVRQARALSYRALTGERPAARRDGTASATPNIAPTALSLSLARRHFARIVYLEEQLTELTLIEEQLERPNDRADQHQLLLHLRALMLHNLFLAVRGFLGINDSRLLAQTVAAYKLALEEPGNLKNHLVVGYAAMLAERGSRREARELFSKLSEQERDSENIDLVVAYYYLALGDRSRAIVRLMDTSRREGWQRGGTGREGRALRSQVYRMNDFDRLRDHPRFTELVTDPEER